MARLVFAPPLVVDRFNLEQLTPLQREQFLIAGRGAWARDSLAVILSCSESEQMIWEYYRVTQGDTGAAAYDAWILADDNGTLFVADTTEETGIVMIQSGFQTERSGIDPALVEEVAAAYKRARPPFDGARFDAYWEEFYRKLHGDAGESATSEEPKVPAAPAPGTAPEAPAKQVAPEKAGKQATPKKPAPKGKPERPATKPWREKPAPKAKPEKPGR